jgi:hypothetical protein
MDRFAAEAFQGFFLKVFEPEGFELKGFEQDEQKRESVVH